MDFLKSTLVSAISKDPPFQFTFHDAVSYSSVRSVWTLYNGTIQATSTPCSIFTFEVNESTRSRLQLARNCVRKWRTLRHPGVVKVLDSVETDRYIYIATERVVPLGWHIARGALIPEVVKWGLWAVAVTIKFLNDDATSIHGNVCADSVYISECGEWKMAGFEVLSSVRDDEPFIYTHGSLLPDVAHFSAPEVDKGGWQSLKSLPIHVTDSWGFGILAYQAFNDTMSSSGDLTQLKKIPANMAMAFKRLISTNPKTRLAVAHFLEQGCRARSFFDIPLIHISESVENIGVKEKSEQEEFLNKLESARDQFPDDFLKMKIVPELLKSIEFGGGGPKVFSAVLRVGDKLNDEEWETLITPAVVRMFALPDRATRVFLLDNLGVVIDHLSKKVVNDKIFPEMLTGFSDMAPLVREQTLKAVLIVIPKLSDRNVNGDLLKSLAKTQNDEQPGIRTNTTICLEIAIQAANTYWKTRKKVLVAAFTRSLRDPFVPARNAALLALAATSEVFDETDCATKVIPTISPTLVDKEKFVRMQAQKTLDIYLARIKLLTASYPDTLGKPEISVNDSSGSSATTAAAGDGGWAGWAISSFTKKIGSAPINGEIQRAKIPILFNSNASAPNMASVESSTTAEISHPDATITEASASTAGGVLADDDDEMEGWGDFDEDPVDSVMTEKTLVGNNNGFITQRMTRAMEKSLNSQTGGGISSFGPKPFNLRQPGKETELKLALNKNSRVGKTNSNDDCDEWAWDG